jgi:hypothetical protein
MIWSLRFRDRQTAAIVRDEDNREIAPSMDWLVAERIVTAHNADIDRLDGRNPDPHGMAEERRRHP